jgi:tRNA nucleotidyltransferase/poly(A) polymerase
MKILQAVFRDKELFIRLFGRDVYAVGGFVRDRLRSKDEPSRRKWPPGQSPGPRPPGILSEDSEDVDILVARHSLDVLIAKLEPFGKVDLVGRSFGVVKFTIQGKSYDVALPRKDRPKSEGARGHKDILVQSDPDLPIEADLERRDFRANSIALRLADGRLVDPFGGAQDIEAKLLRVTNPKAFPEDPLRVLRAARFASVMGFRLDPAIYPLAKAIDLAGLSVERINEELFKILLLSESPSVGLEELFKLGALRQVFPELYALTLVIQDSVFHPEKDDFGHHTVWHHTKLSVNQAKRLAGVFKLAPTRALALLLAALYHDVGKAETTQWEFKRGRMVITSAGHDVASERLARRIFGRFRIFSWNGYPLKKTALLLIKTHHRASEIWAHRETVTRKAFNRFVADTGGEIELAVVLDVADRGGRKERPVKRLDREGRWLLAKLEELRVSKETIKPLLLGRDLLKLGVAPGPGMGKILGELYKRQLDNEFETRAQGLAIARKIVGGRS